MVDGAGRVGEGGAEDGGEVAREAGDHRAKLNQQNIVLRNILLFAAQQAFFPESHNKRFVSPTKIGSSVYF